MNETGLQYAEELLKRYNGTPDEWEHLQAIKARLISASPEMLIDAYNNGFHEGYSQGFDDGYLHNTRPLSILLVFISFALAFVSILK